MDRDIDGVQFTIGYGNKTRGRYCVPSSCLKTYIYGTDGNVSGILDTASNTRTKYVYDLSGRLVKTKEYSGADLTSNLLLSNVEYIYQDKTNYLTQMNHSSPLGNLAVAFGYGNIASGQMPDQVYNVWWNGTTHMSRTFDGLGRLSSSVINGVLRTNYHYKDVSATQTTTQLQSMETPVGNLAYTYDSVGNITSIYNGVNLISYEYDSLNQLVRENDQRTGKTYTYTYHNGNILSKTEYAYTTGALGEVVNTIYYGYGDNVWKDLLTSYNGVNITYDEIGNMISFGGRTFDWTGRQLNNFVDSNSYGIYYYNMDGQRIYKEANGVTTNYYYNGDILAGQISSDGTKLVFLYDENGDIFGLTYEGYNYYYVKNAQNDVIAIADTWGNILCRYEYDAWGKVLSITGDVAWFGQLNPIRYRSYYYDNESGMYYLKSRYYNPEIGRFINADGYVSTGQGILSHNMFAYCNNNPVMYEDSNGDLSQLIKTVINKIIDKIIDIGKKSPSSTVKALAYGVGYARKLNDAKNKGEEVTNKVNESRRILKEYTEDVLLYSSGGEITDTPDEVFFPDIDEYKIMCETGYKRMQRVYPEEMIPWFTAEEIAGNIGTWDEETTTYVGYITAIKVFLEDII